VTPAAESELRAAYRYIRNRAPVAARDWIRGARRAAKTLARRPDPLSARSWKRFIRPAHPWTVFWVGQSRDVSFSVCRDRAIGLHIARPAWIDAAAL